MSNKDWGQEGNKVELSFHFFYTCLSLILMGTPCPDLLDLAFSLSIANTDQ